MMWKPSHDIFRDLEAFSKAGLVARTKSAEENWMVMELPELLESTVTGERWALDLMPAHSL